MPTEPAAPSAQRDTLASLLGGRGGAIDASLPALAFVGGWMAWGRWHPGSADVIVAGSIAALVTGAAVGFWRWRRGAAPRAVVLGMLAVVVGAVVAMRTGRAVDFFLVQILSNAGSALAWTLSILFRWPLLGVVVGGLLGQRFRWRRDPDLLRAYGRASWVWVGQYLVRLAVFVPLWMAEQEVALGIARVALTWPLVAACVAASWWVLRRTLPDGHPGMRHPRLPD